MPTPTHRDSKLGQPSSTRIRSLLDGNEEQLDRVKLQLLVLELFELPVNELREKLLALAVFRPEVCVAASGNMLQSLQGVTTEKTIQCREVICSALALAGTEIVSKDRTAVSNAF